MRSYMYFNHTLIQSFSNFPTVEAKKNSTPRSFKKKV